MYIYKITNKKNGKVYIGKTTLSIEDRFKKHLQDSKTIDTHLYRAMRKYGTENFKIETIEKVEKEDLNSRERYWIKMFNSMEEGYNSTLGGDGGNTFIKKSDEEMDLISQKISQSKIGSKNPNHTPVKTKNIITGEELFFETVKDCKEYFKEDNHNFITRRIANKTKYCYKGEWLIAKAESPFIKDYTTDKGANNRKARMVTVENGDERNTFPTLTSAEKYYGFPKGSLSKVRSRGKNKYKEYTLTFQ